MSTIFKTSCLSTFPPAFFTQIQRCEESGVCDSKSYEDLPILYQTAGEYHQTAGNYLVAHECYIKSINLLLQQNNYVALIGSLNRVARTCFFLKNMPNALDISMDPLIEKVKVYVSQDDSCPRQKLYKSIAVLFSILNNHTQAATYFEFSAAESIKQHEYMLAAEQLTEAANCHNLSEEHILAARCYEKIYAVYQSLKKPCLSAQSLDLAGNSCVKARFPEQAATHFKEAAKQYRHLNLHMYAAECYTKAAKSYNVLSSPPHHLVARYFKRAALELMLCDHEYADKTVGLLKTAARVYRRSGDLVNAADCYREVSDYLNIVRQL